MKPKFKISIDSTNLYRLRVDCVSTGVCCPFEVTEELLSDFFNAGGVKGNLITAELASATEKPHLHCVFASDKKITALRTLFRKLCPELKYSFSQNWSKETKSQDMKKYMNENELTYQDIHIIYILKDSNIRTNTLISNTEELDFEEIRKTIGCRSKKQKKYGNYTKKLIMDYNEQFPQPLIDTSCGSLDDYAEKERIFRFVTHQMSAHNLDIFLSNAKKFDDFVIKQLCQTLLNTRKYSDIYPDCFKNDVLKYFL